MNRTNIKEELENAVRADSRATTLESVEARPCGSDDFDGIEYSFRGEYIPIRPIIDVVARREELAIEQMGFVNEGEEYTYLHVFVAELDLPEQPHPAFVDGSTDYRE
jgi:hypothetical protein